jgi:hypothetical protein
MTGALGEAGRMSLIRRGRTAYGAALGVLMLDTCFPRPLGDIGNAETWPFPVRYHVVRGAAPLRVVGERPDPVLLEPFLAGARDLEAFGVQVITTSCGFLAAFQREIAAAVAVPVVTSSLLQAPVVARTLRPHQRVAILTALPDLNDLHFTPAGFAADDARFAISVLPEDCVFNRAYLENRPDCDLEMVERELVELARLAVREHDPVGALVLECTNFAPYSQAIRAATGLPVYTINTLILSTMAAVDERRFAD